MRDYLKRNEKIQEFQDLLMTFLDNFFPHSINTKHLSKISRDTLIRLFTAKSAQSETY